MRRIEITNREFRYFIWPALAFTPVENGGQVDAHVRLLGKVKPASEPTAEESEDQIAGRELTSGPLALRLEEDEYGHLKRRLEQWLPRVAGGILDDFKDLQDRLEDLEQVEEQDVKPASEAEPERRGEYAEGGGG